MFAELVKYFDGLCKWYKYRSVFSRFYPPPGIIELQDPPSQRLLSVDICIITHCGFPGGNAATTVTEAEAFVEAGYSVAIVHCSVRRSRWKWNWTAERYLLVADTIYPAHRVKHVICNKLIVRGPRMMLTNNFRRLTKRISAEHAIFVVNNSAYGENGKTVFSWSELHKRIASLGWPSVELCPTGPIIREEAEREMSKSKEVAELSVRDWSPVIEASKFKFRPRNNMVPPIVIGRHARDHPGKWLVDRSDLLAVYPEDDPDIQVDILGGAETVDNALGGVPSCWTVRPFGVDSVQTYLEHLDVFVNFPSPALHEAFGRTVVEAILSGLPVILPPRFEATFGDLAFYCAPNEVRGLISAISEDDTSRLAYLEEVRTIAENLYCTPNLLSRLDNRVAPQKPTLDGDAGRWRQAMIQASTAPS
ncbi:Glycosyltransferase involved in cell wall bisynthesis [Sulfitobacter litoralis]|uniref:Glycosyltransferase involved in cell wall bisynthesis n=2 Tax=Sulfitobacter litoralis TaxID=335975 RepID=A0ABY0SV40_9RHOB|nr:Glycosyltransferase involved in cell wall bisynthesis [Sulfitobacter litoralis]